MIHYTELGATLFIPATHKNLFSVASGEKYPELRSLVIDTEDGLDDDLLLEASHAIQTLLQQPRSNKPFLFLRPRDPKHLKEVLEYEGIEKLNGFVLPKFSLHNAQEYFEILSKSSHAIMPSIESDELFEMQKLIELKDLILEQKEKVILIRFGLEDMLKRLSMRRSCEQSIFDVCVTSTILGNFLAVFKSAGFAVSGGVYPCFKDEDGFKQDVLRDLQEGLFSKTIIHPKQIAPLHELYKVTKEELDEAQKLCQSPHVVLALNGKMGETKTMTPWTEHIIQRSKIYGIR